MGLEIEDLEPGRAQRFEASMHPLLDGPRTVDFPWQSARGVRASVARPCSPPPDRTSVQKFTLVGRLYRPITARVPRTITPADIERWRHQR